MIYIDNVNDLPKGKYILSDIINDRIILRYLMPYDNSCLYSLPLSCWEIIKNSFIYCYL